MPRTHLLHLLKQYQTALPNEQAMLAQMITFVEQYPDCMSRSLALGHVTGSAWIVDQARTHALLIYHAKLDAWFQPGGHADEGEKITAVSLREATEETGLSLQMLGDQIFDIDIHLIPARKTEIAHFHYDVRFVFEADRDQLPTISAESKDLRWIPLSEIQDFNSEASIMRMVQKTAFI